MRANELEVEMDLFHEVLELPEDQRESFLNARCGDSSVLAGRLRKLLKGHERAQAAVTLERELDPVPAPLPSSIDSYRVIQKLGEGGMGVVYVAEQTRPVRRRVAIKLAKSVIGSDEVIARFHAERQALALMNHKCIAQILDAGVFDGRPYFVMELIAGVPITEYCDRRALGIADRLRLFVEVCQGVQHAHQRGVIHRDLKPPNVLVSDDAGVWAPKIIDFGIAKALEHRLTEHTMVTQFGQLIGTPAYMSPEQAGTNAWDIDTRVDVYSLGALLYEMLTGFTPLDFTKIGGMGLDEVMQVIRDEEPLRPSQRLARVVGAEAQEISRYGSDGGRVTTLLRGELDWIVMKALDKDRDGRYASVSALSEDIQRYLSNQPVLAGPPSGAYRARKFVRRHKGLIAGGALFVGALIVGTAVSTLQYLEAESARREADQRASELEQVARFQEKQLAGIDVPRMAAGLHRGLLDRAHTMPATPGSEPVEDRVSQLERLLAGADFTGLALDALDENVFAPEVGAINEQFAGQPLVRARLLQTMADTVRQLGLLDRATAPQVTALEIRRQVLGADHPDTLTSLEHMGVLLLSQGKLEEAAPHLQESLDGRRRVLGDAHPDTLDSVSNMGVLLRSQGKPDEAEPYYREALDGRRRVLGNDHSDTLSAVANMSVLLKTQGKLDEAMALSREALEGRRHSLGDDDPNTLNAVSNMGVLLRIQGKLDEADTYYQEALEGRRRVLGHAHPDTLTSIQNMGVLRFVQGKHDEAEAYYREALDGRRRYLGNHHLDTLDSVNNMGVLLRNQGKLTEAEAFYREALDGTRRVLGDDHPLTLSAVNNMGVLLRAQGKLGEAEPLYREALEGRRRVYGDEHTRTLHSLNNLGLLLQAKREWIEAEACLRQSLETGRRILGKEHPDTLFWTHSLGTLLMELGRSEEALTYLTEAVTGNRRILGEEHADTVMSITDMGILLNELGRHEDAARLLAEGEPAARRVFSDGNAFRLGSLLTELGESRAQLGEHEKAESKLVEAHALLAAGLGDQHSRTMTTVQRLVRLYTVRDASDPDAGYAAKADTWRAKLPGQASYGGE